MEKHFERCAAMKFFCKVGFTAAKMWEMFAKSFADSSAARAMVLRWHSRFVVGEESIEDTEWSRRPGTTKTTENTAQVAAVLKDNRRASCRMIAESTGYQKP